MTAWFSGTGWAPLNGTPGWPIGRAGIAGGMVSVAGGAAYSAAAGAGAMLLAHPASAVTAIPPKSKTCRDFGVRIIRLALYSLVNIKLMKGGTSRPAKCSFREFLILNNNKEATAVRNILLFGTAVAGLLTAVSANAELPVPPMAAAPQQADAYLFYGGAGDIFEITTSMMAQHHASNPQVKTFATMLIADHTNLTNGALAAAKGAGLMPPPPELSPMQKQMITELMAAGPNFDRVFLQQQLTAHQQALQLQNGYASNGDVAALRSAAASAVPVVQGHIAQIQRMMRGM